VKEENKISLKRCVFCSNGEWLAKVALRHSRGLGVEFLPKTVFCIMFLSLRTIRYN